MKDKTELTWEQGQQIVNKSKQEEQEREKEFNQNLSDVADEVNERIHEGPFNYNDIEDIMSGYGLEMDYIEDILF